MKACQFPRILGQTREAHHGWVNSQHQVCLPFQEFEIYSNKPDRHPSSKLKLLFSRYYWLENSAWSKDTHWCLLQETKFLQYTVVSYGTSEIQNTRFWKRRVCITVLRFVHCISHRLSGTLRPGLRNQILLLLNLHVRLKLGIQYFYKELQDCQRSKVATFSLTADR